MIKDEIYHTS